MNQALDTHLSDVGLLASLPQPHPQRKAVLSSDAIYHAPPPGARYCPLRAAQRGQYCAHGGGP